jgi:hypothetical protein
LSGAAKPLRGVLGETPNERKVDIEDGQLYIAHQISFLRYRRFTPDGEIIAFKIDAKRVILFFQL